NGVVLIAGERIVAVGRKTDIALPTGVRVISTEGMSVLPGLADMHVHLMIVGHGDYEHWDTTYRSRFQKEIMPAAAKQLLLAGVTTARDLGAQLGHHRREATHRAGRDSRAPVVRLRSVPAARAVLAVRSAVPLGGERHGRRPRQGQAAGTGRRGRDQADRSGPDDGAGSGGGGRGGA